MSGAVLATGTLFARDFRIVSPLGHGGMGTVYVAEQLSTGKRRALKLMHPTLVSEAELRERFVREARVGSRIASEHVVEVQAAGVDEATGLPYIAMELLEGETLQSYVKRREFLPPGESHLVFSQLCHAMIAAHSAGIIHRDLKPENVFLSLSRRAGGPPFVVKVLDFGIAKLAAEAGTRGTTGAMGSPLWMAPEQTERGAITAAADVWALGLIAYFTLTGSVFWRAARDPQTTVAQVLREIVLEPIPAATIRANESGLLDRLPPGFDRFFAQCVVRDPAARFKDASAFWTAMGGLFESLGATMAVLPPSSGMRPQPAAPSLMVPSSGGVVSGGPMSPMPMTPGPMSPGPMSPAPMTPAAQTPMQPMPMMPGVAPTLGTAPPLANTMTRGSSVGPWIFGSTLVVVAAVGGLAYLVTTHVKTPAIPVIPSAVAVPAPPPAPSALTMSTAPTDTAQGAPIPTPPPSTTNAATAQATQQPQAQKVDPRSGTAAPAASLRTGNATSVSHGTNDVYVDGMTKRRTWKVAGHTVRVVPGNVQVSGNISADIARDALDWHPWEYLLCYEKAFKEASSLPTGTVTLRFKIFDQLPRQGTIDKSDFTNAGFSTCVLNTAMGNTANAAGSDGFATVVYPLVFTLVD